MELIKIFKALFYKFLVAPYYRCIFKKFGKNSRIEFPSIIEGSSKILIDNNVFIRRNSRLECLNYYADAKLLIKSRARIESNAHIIALKSITIGTNVTIAQNVYISDNIHGYEDIHVPIRDQDPIFRGECVIGDDSWIGENACIIGAIIGKHCIIGANAVVQKNIPDYCVVVGVPGRIVKRYNPATMKWEKTSKEGCLI